MLGFCRKFSFIIILIFFSFLSLINGVPITSLTCAFDKYESLCSWDPLKTSYPFNWKWIQFNTSTLNFNGALGPVGNKGSFIQTYNRNVSSRTETGALESPLIDPTQKPTCFKFHYYINQLSGEKITLSLISGQKAPEIIWKENHLLNSGGDIWHIYMLHIPPQNTSFKLKFVIASGDGAIAFDQFSGSAKQCPEQTPGVTVTQKKTTYLNLDCNFDSGSVCNWKLDQTNPWYMNRFNVILAPMMPTVDHSMQSIYGRYMYVLHTVGMNVPKKLAFMTAIDKKSSEHICVSLWYYMRTDSYSQLNVSIKGTSLQVISRFNDWGEKWNLLRFEALGFQFKISAMVTNGIVAIDDIQVSHERCAPLNSNVFECTFEEGHICGFTPFHAISTNHIHLYQGNETSIKTFDHTFKTMSGHYMALDISRKNRLPLRMTLQTNIISQLFPQTRGSCLTFSYYLTGIKFSEILKLFIKQENVQYKDVISLRPLWYVQGEQGPFWYTHRRTISSPVQWQIMFNFNTKNARKGLIAIDDVMLDIDKPCPPAGRCDFEKGDTCMWESIRPTQNGITQQEKLRWSNISIGVDVLNNIVLNTDFTWTVHSPIHANSPLYPKVDHTLNQAIGNYLLLRAQNPRKLYDRAVLMSDRYDIDLVKKSLCLKFFYYLKNQAEYSVYSRLEVYQSENYKQTKKIYQIYSISGSTPHWIEFTQTVKPENIRSTNMWFYLVGTTGTLGSYIAIDDISIDSGECVVPVQPSQMFNCTRNEWIPRSKVCDYARDCSNGYDERACGSCNFENNDLCGYSKTFKGKTNDVKTYQWRFGDYITGPRIGTYGSSGYMIARRVGSTFNEPKGQTDLQTPQIHGASDGCRIGFQYNILGNPITRTGSEPLSVYLNVNGFEMTQIWNSDAMNVPQGLWLTGYAFLKRINYNFSIIFRANDEGEKTDSYVALDAIRFLNCALPSKVSSCPSGTGFWCANGVCINKNYVCDFADDCGDNSDEIYCNDDMRCNFENGFCNWDSNQRGKWILRNGVDNLVNGPTRDHTKGLSSGRFMYLQSSVGNTPTVSILDGPIFEPNLNCHINVWVSIEGNASLTFKVQHMDSGVSYDIQTFRNPSQTPSFTYIRYVITFAVKTFKYRALFAGTVTQTQNQTYLSYIALDDISFSPQCSVSNVIPRTVPTFVTTPSPCSINQFACNDTECINKSQVCDFFEDCSNGEDEKHCGSCSFDKNDMCGWTNVGIGKQQWSLQPASKLAAITNNIPIADSTGNKAGSFLIIDTSRGGTYDTPAIISTPLLGSTAPNCRMTFSYHQTYPGNNVFLSVYLVRVRDSFQKLLLNVNQPYSKWTTFSAQIGSLEAGYQIKIWGKGQPIPTTKPFADMEIDNIQFVNCETTNETALNCSFEVDTCGWRDVDLTSNSRLDWIRTRDPQIDPGYDHTSRARPRPLLFGSWLTTRRELGMTGNNTSTLMTIKQLTSAEPKCLTFWYHMFGRDPANFALVLNQNQSELGGYVLWVKKLPQSNNWLKAQVTVQNNNPYYLMFRATLQSQMSSRQDTIGLDDITFTTGSCPDTPFCDFEANTCGWSPKNNSWVRTTPNTSLTTIPATDHTLGLTTGTYMRISVWNTTAVLEYTFNDTTPLNNSMPSPKRSMCIKFWYYYNNFGTYSLSVEVESNLSGTPVAYMCWKANSQSQFQNQWLYARANITIRNRDKIRIKADANNMNTVIAVDDILVQSHPCEPMGWCDFESDFCGWYNAPPTLNTKQVLWLHNSGSTSSSNSGPKRDHTTGSTEGWYAFVPLDSQGIGSAVLQSELISYGRNVCLQFFYHIVADNHFYSPKLTIMYTTLTNPIVVATIHSQNNAQWNGFNVNLTNMPPVFRFIFKTVGGNVSRSDIAIDDIQVFNGSCFNPLIPITSTPRKPTPEPVSEKQLDCNFESANCKWTQDLNWKRTSWVNGISRFGPRVDHTLKTVNGHYLLFTPNPNTTSPAQIKSALIPVTNNPHCISFWYYSDSESYINISIGYIYPTGVLDLVNRIFLVTPTMISNTWKQIRSQLPVMRNIQVVIGLNFNKSIFGGFAIDDIKVTQDECPVRSNEICDFSYNYCGYKVEREAPAGGKGIGVIANSHTLQDLKLRGPQIDHTTKNTGNYFLFANQDTDIDGLYRTSLIINNLPKTLWIGSCLKFWYQIKSNYTTSFQIFVVHINSFIYNTPKWMVTFPNHTTWTMAQLTVNAEYNHKIVFSLVQTKNPLSYIALNDISVSDGSCEPPVSCDFDTDSCSWHDIDNLTLSNWNWRRFTSPPVNNTWPGPTRDHTIMSWGGSYLYITAYRQINQINRDRNAFIQSMSVAVNGSKCFSYWTQLLGNDTSIQVSVVKYGNFIDLKNQIQIISVLNGTRKTWTKVNVNINPIMFSNTAEFAIRIKGKINNPMSFIALDDVKLTDGVCSSSALVPFYCRDGTQLDISKVCNFVKDCLHNDDELSCGACDFETDTCGWTNKYSFGGQWIRKGANNRSAPAGPMTDGRNNNMGHYLIVNPKSLYPVPTLQSSINIINRFKRAHMLCTMTFNYYVKSNTVQPSSIRIYIISGISSSDLIWRSRGDMGNKWDTASASVYQQRGPFTIRIIGFTSLQSSIMAIDNIVFQNCAPQPSATDQCPVNTIKCPNNNVCIDQYSLCDGIDDCGDDWDESYSNCHKITIPMCQFEVQTIFCNWAHEVDVGSKADWTYVKSGIEWSRMTGPVTDHTFRRINRGTFLALKSSVADYGKKSRIVTPWVQSIIPKACALRLFYYMFGNSSQMGSLKVYARFSNESFGNTMVLFNTNGNRGQQWFRATAAVPDPRPFQFVIEGQVGSGNLADIAIDDVSFSDGCVRANPIIVPTLPTRPPTVKVTTPLVTKKPPIVTNPKPSTSDTFPTFEHKPTTSALFKTTIKKFSITTSVHFKLTTKKSTIGNESTGSKKAGSDTGSIVAGVLVPVFVIAIIAGIWYYRRYRLHQSEDRIRLADPTYGASNLSVINLAQVHHNHLKEDE